ncbi:hypothetical protein JZ751_023895 [Albula glossodonta]|uniref:Cdc37 C-terminal domain-containing protein n=1 Tax=Albula glossodonta TaxID=121402 RepID=A0A8T2N1V8_9TELE|nr:hypothetical protein JZ751_023895 [Albula glossodonta]
MSLCHTLSEIPPSHPLSVFTSSSSHEAKVHMQRCIDSGLWVPNSRGGEDDAGEKEEDKEETEKEEKKE